MKRDRGFLERDLKMKLPIHIQLQRKIVVFRHVNIKEVAEEENYRVLFDFVQARRVWSIW